MNQQKDLENYQAVIYGLFSEDGRCSYVGQTMNPRNREIQHLYLEKSKFAGRGLVFRIIRETNFKNVNRLERQIGNAFKRRGMAELSTKFAQHHTKKIVGTAVEIYVEGFQYPFYGVLEACRVLNCSPTTLRNALKRKTTIYAWGQYMAISYGSLPLNYEI